MKKKALGKGLGALYREIEDVASKGASDEVRQLPLAQVRPNPEQVRRDFDPEAIAELAQSIEQHGLLEPILVTPTPDGQTPYLIVAGERRYRAMQRLGRAEISAIVRDFPPEDLRKLSLIENIQRENLNPVEEAMSYRDLMAETGLTQAAFAQEIGKSRSHVANVLRLLQLAPEVLERVRKGVISFGHAKVLSALPLAEQIALARRIERLGLSVRDTEARAKRTPPAQNPYVADVEERLTERLMTRVRLLDNKGKGKIEIAFYSPEERDRLIEIFESL